MDRHRSKYVRTSAAEVEKSEQIDHLTEAMAELLDQELSNYF